MTNRERRLLALLMVLVVLSFRKPHALNLEGTGMTDYPAPEQRVRAWLDAMQDDFPDRDTIGLGYYSSGKQELTASDLRDVLNELEETRSLLEQIDAVLDQLNGFNDADVLNAVLKLLGNNRKD